MVVCCIQRGYTPLHDACERDDKEVALLLIEHGANVKAEDKVRVVTDDTYTCIFDYSTITTTFILFFFLL